MNKYLDELVKLSICDNQISAFEPKIEGEKSKLAIFLKAAQNITASIDKHNEEIDEVNSKISKNNLHLSELKDKLDDIAKKSANIKTDKELKALNLEEEIAKEQISFANEEINRFEEILESKESLIADLRVDLVKQEESIKNLEGEVNEAVEQLNKQRNDIYKQREELLNNFDNKIFTFYEKIKRWAKTTAVVPVKKQACYGCHMKINDYIYTEVIKSEVIVNCPHCGRILYKEEETQEA